MSAVPVLCVQVKFWSVKHGKLTCFMGEKVGQNWRTYLLKKGVFGLALNNA